jgi:hypothetical protein
MDQLRKLLGDRSEHNNKLELTASQVEEALTIVPDRKPTIHGRKKKLPPECILAKFLLIRWDQLHELASLIKKKSGDPNTIILTTEVLTNALSEFSEPSLMTCEPFIDYRESRQYQQYDFSKVNVWTIRGNVPERFEKEVKPRAEDEGGGYLYESRKGFADFGKMSGNCKIEDPGVISIQ